MDLSKKLKNSISYRALTVARSNKSKEAFILTATMLTLASCGGGGGGGSGGISSSQPSSILPNITGTVVKGPLHNALVFADYNNDGLLSAGEPSTRTAADGSFVLNSNDPSANFVSISDSQTTDSFTGENVSGIKLKAPGGSSVVTPATTLLVEIKKSSPSISNSEVANALGLSGVDITSFNPFAAGVDQNLALVSEKVANQIISTVSTISAAAEGTGANKDIAFDKAVGAVSSAVINEINDGNSTDSLIYLIAQF